MTTTIDRLLLVSSASFADGKKRMQQNPLRRRFSLCSPLSNYAFPARLIQNLMKLDESPGSTSLVHLSPPVAAAYHICPSVKGRRLDRPDVSRRMRIEGRRGGSNDDRPRMLEAYRSLGPRPTSMSCGWLASQSVSLGARDLDDFWQCR